MTVTITSIPAPYRPGLAGIRKLSADSFAVIVSALEGAPVTGRLKDLASAVAQQAPRLGRQEIEDILRALFSLSVLVADEDAPLVDNIATLSRAMQVSGNADLALSEEEKVEFESRLRRLLEIKAVLISSKVQRLRLEFPVTFHDAVVLTDMRPVFDKPEDRPLGFAVSHTLRIAYHENGEHKEFFVVLDDEDLEMVRKAVLRAQLKAASVRSLLQVNSLRDLS